MNHKKLFWIVSGVFITIVLCVLLVWFGGGMVEMVKAHLGI